MSLIDCLWLITWFVAGLFVFETGGKTKFFLKSISGIFSFISALFFIPEFNEFEDLIFIFGLDKLYGFLTLFSYLIGANISRLNHMGKFSYRTFVYIALFLAGILIIDYFSEIKEMIEVIPYI